MSTKYVPADRAAEACLLRLRFADGGVSPADFAGFQIPGHDPLGFRLRSTDRDAALVKLVEAGKVERIKGPPDYYGRIPTWYRIREDSRNQRAKT